MINEGIDSTRSITFAIDEEKPANMALQSKPAGQDQARMSYAQAPPDFDLDRAVKDIEEWDVSVFMEILSTRLTDEQIQRVLTPINVFPRQKRVLAIHWHPEWIPLDLIRQRIETMFPNRERELVIPTQHNELLTMGEYAGVEVDAHAPGFHSKVQLLMHFKADRVAEAGVLRAMLDHTFKYRSGQMFDFIASAVDPQYDERMRLAAAQTGATDEVVDLVRFYMARLRQLIYDHESDIPPIMIKNKLLSEFLDAQRDRHPDNMINRGLLLLKAVKAQVKKHFPLDYFFDAAEVIEEARGLGGGVVIPHPEQFWPILLADYDVDGVEVWNPQSREYTEFLITAIHRQNKRDRNHRRPMLIFMGDDTHMSVKIKDPKRQERAKLEREAGLQPAWDDIAIRKNLSLAGANRTQVIDEYKERLG
jgi:hypothetical protein